MSDKAQIEESTFKDRGFELEQGISKRVVSIRCFIRDVNRDEFIEVMKGYFSPLVPSSSKEKLDEIKRLVKLLKEARLQLCSCKWDANDKYQNCRCGRDNNLRLADINLTNYLENL